MTGGLRRTCGPLLFFLLEIANDVMFQVFCMTDYDCNTSLKAFAYDF